MIIDIPTDHRTMTAGEQALAWRKQILTGIEEEYKQIMALLKDAAIPQHTSYHADITLTDKVVDPSSPYNCTWQLAVGCRGLLVLKIHSGETTIGHAAETSTRDYEYYHGKSMNNPDSEIAWRTITYPFSKTTIDDNKVALVMAHNKIKASDIFKRLELIKEANI